MMTRTTTHPLEAIPLAAPLPRLCYCLAFVEADAWDAQGGLCGRCYREEMEAEELRAEAEYRERCEPDDWNDPGIADPWRGA